VLSEQEGVSFGLLRLLTASPRSLHRRVSRTVQTVEQWAQDYSGLAGRTLTASRQHPSFIWVAAPSPSAKNLTNRHHNEIWGGGKQTALPPPQHPRRRGDILQRSLRYTNKPTSTKHQEVHRTIISDHNYNHDRADTFAVWDCTNKATIDLLLYPSSRTQLFSTSLFLVTVEIRVPIARS